MPIKIDLHVHTCYSHDASITAQELIYYVRKRGLNGVAITDHNTMRGAAKFQEKVNECLVLPGVEIDTKRGHIIALFLKPPKNFKPQFPIPELEEAIETVHDYGGLAIAAHPTSLFRGELRRHVTREFNAIEVMNASAIPFCFSKWINRKIAVKHGLPQTGGSDAHQAKEIGAAYTVINSEPSLMEIFEAILGGAIYPCGRRIPWKARLEREIQTLKQDFSQ